MAVAMSALAMGEKPLRDDEMQVVPGAGHRDVEQPAFLFGLGGGADAQVGGNAAVDDVENVDRLPFLYLGGVDGREDQIVFVAMGNAGLVAAGSGGSSVRSVRNRWRDG